METQKLSPLYLYKIRVWFWLYVSSWKHWQNKIKLIKQGSEITLIWDTSFMQTNQSNIHSSYKWVRREEVVRKQTSSPERSISTGAAVPLVGSPRQSWKGADATTLSCSFVQSKHALWSPWRFMIWSSVVGLLPCLKNGGRRVGKRPIRRTGCR